MAKLKVLIVGAGLGGLCLAQSLRRHDVDVEVFERDTSPWDRPQGYRLHIDSDGVNALYQSLPPHLYHLFDVTSMKPLPFTTIVDTNLAIQHRMSSDEQGSEHVDSSRGLPPHVNVNRATLRQILFTGLQDNIHFGKKLSHYESDEQSVTVTFEDGTHVTGNLLVGVPTFLPVKIPSKEAVVQVEDVMNELQRCIRSSTNEPSGQDRYVPFKTPTPRL